MSTISSLEEYVEHVDFAIDNVLQSQYVWFRGHANYDFKLVPSILRKMDYSTEMEKHLNQEFQDKAKGFITNFSDFNSAELYFLMQHYGLRTRLLDWTEGSLIALFFSLKLSQGDNSHKNPCIWMINPIEMIQYSQGKKEIIRINENKELLEKYFSNENVDESLDPIAISSTYSNQRILRQKGCFTVHRSDKGILNLYRKAKSNRIIRLIIDRKKAGQMINQLNLAGISESAIFPDLEGLTRELNQKIPN
ncbi:MAG: FRG domain-containing protein [Flagellimonas sp.]